MSWILILLSLLPDIIDLVLKIMSAIKGKPLLQRASYRKELGKIARKHIVTQKGARTVYVLKTSGSAVQEDLHAMLERLS